MCREVMEDSPDLCKRCALGFYLKDGNKECLPNCLSLSTTFSQTFTCASCKAGYSMTQAMKCIAYIPNCLEYKTEKTSNNCLRCQEGFKLNQDQTECIVDIEKCVDQVNNMCLKCINGFIPDPETQLFCIVEVKNWCATNGIPNFNPGKAIYGFKYDEQTKECKDTCLLRTGPTQCLICQPPYILLQNPNICWDPTDKYINPYQRDVLLDRCIRYDGDRCMQCYSPFSDPDCSASCANPFSEGLKAKCVPQGDRQEYLLNSNNQCVPKIVNCSKQLDTSTCEVCCQGFLLSQDKKTCCSGGGGDDSNLEKEGATNQAKTEESNKSGSTESGVNKAVKKNVNKAKLSSKIRKAVLSHKI